MDTKQISAADALERLKEGNRIYIGSRNGAGDVSPEKRQEASRNGQHPYAVVVSCADSRVIPGGYRGVIHGEGILGEWGANY